MREDLLFDAAAALVKILIVVNIALVIGAYMSLVERKVSAWMQDRIGPNRVGPVGLLQPIADGLKFMFKEDVVPGHVNRVLYILAPAIVLVPAFLVLAVIPFGPPMQVLGRPVQLAIADLDIGILFVFAISSLGVYGIVFAGWASNSKYAMLGGVRSSAQMISYEVSLGLSVVGVFMATQSLRLTDVVNHQADGTWNCFAQPIGFLVFVVCAFAETNRLPFDLPEAETELVAGFHTEYSSMKFALLQMAEYVNMITVAAVGASLFFGGWLSPLPFLPDSPLWFFAKMLAALFFFIWLRGTLPRLRYDQLMAFGWKVLVPLATLNILVTAAVVAFVPAGWRVR